MFRVFVRKRKRRLSSPRIVALSAGIHLVLFGAVVAASTARSAPARPAEVVDIWDVPAKAPPPEPAAPEQPRQPDAPPLPTPGETIELPAPTATPTELPRIDPDARPIRAEDVTGQGRLGDVIGPPAPAPTPPTGNTTGEPGPPSYDGYVYGPEMVEAMPALVNGREVARMFDRNYPRALAEAGIAGTVTLEMIVEKDGRVRPGSVRVVSSTHPEFSEATLRIVERFRFTPARMGEQPVPVTVTLPVEWKPEAR